MQQSSLCGVQQWISGYSNVGGFDWAASQIIIGVKSWCGGDTAATCSSADTGLWGHLQMSNIIQQTGAGGVYMWDINDYFVDAYFNAGNPVNYNCDWANRIATTIGLKGASPTYADSTMCQTYSGPTPWTCTPAL